MKFVLVIALLFATCSASTDASAFIHEHGYWCGESVAENHCFDPKLSLALVDFFKEEKAASVVDFGCGLGEYVKVLLSHGLTCEGYDGNPDTFRLSGGVAKVQDLSKPFQLPKTFDWALSLEVGEHIPAEYEKVFMENLHRHNVKGIVLSWAVKGQGGYGHFNEQDNDYIKGKMMKYGYINDLPAERALRKNATLPWFKNTVMVFRKQ